MMRVALIAMTVLCLSVAPPAMAWPAWEPPQEVAETSDELVHPVFDGTFRSAAVAWIEESRLYFRSLRPSGELEKTIQMSEEGEPVWRPALAVTPDGGAALAWFGGGAVRLARRRSSDQAFDIRNLSSGEVWPDSIRIAANDSNDLAVTWLERLPSGGAWRLMVAYGFNGGPLGNAGVLSREPTLTPQAVTMAGPWGDEGFAVWEERASDGAHVLMSTNFSSSGIEGPVPIQRLDPEAGEPSFGDLQAGGSYNHERLAAWTARSCDACASRVYLAMATHEGLWGAPQAVAAFGLNSELRLTAEFGGAQLAWRSQDTSAQPSSVISFRFYGGGAFSETSGFTVRRASIDPRLAAGPSWLLAWREARRGGITKLFYAVDPGNSSSFQRELPTGDGAVIWHDLAGTGNRWVSTWIEDDGQGQRLRMAQAEEDYQSPTLSRFRVLRPTKRRPARVAFHVSEPATVTLSLRRLATRRRAITQFEVDADSPDLHRLSPQATRMLRTYGPYGATLSAIDRAGHSGRLYKLVRISPPSR